MIIVIAIAGLLLIAIPVSVVSRYMPVTAVRQSQSQLYGKWTGDSICQVRESACHDEKAVYTLAKSDVAGKVSITAAKIVDGKTVVFGTSDFDYDEKSHTLSMQYEHGIWVLTINGNKMTGTLTTPDKVVFRRVALEKKD